MDIVNEMVTHTEHQRGAMVWQLLDGMRHNKRPTDVRVK